MIIADSSCEVAELPIANSAYQDCSADPQPDLVPIPESAPVVEELAVPSPTLADQAPDEPTARPVDPPSSQPAKTPAPLAVPDQSKAPKVPTPNPTTESPTESPTTGIVGDRYSNNDDLFGPPEAEAATTPKLAPGLIEDDLFGPAKPFKAFEKKSPDDAVAPSKTTVSPSKTAVAPSKTTEEPSQDTEPPAPVEPDSSDPFGDNLPSHDPSHDPSQDPSHDDRASVLEKAGGLLSKVGRTWTDRSTTDRSSTFLCEARLLRVTAKHVVLQQSNGAKLVVPLARLANGDLHFVHQQITTLRVVRAREAAAEKLAVAWAR